MQPRIDLLKASPEAIKPMYAIEAYLKNCGLEHSLLLLVKMRASQINGCAYCLDMHSETHAPDDVFEELRAHFSEREIADLTLAIGAINAWNRFAISFRVEVGTYQPGKHAASGAAARH